MDLTHSMHLLKLLLSRYLLNNLQLFINVKVSVGMLGPVKMFPLPC